MLEVTARRLADGRATRHDILGHRDVFPQQRAFISHPAKLKALFCTRRSAKSYTGGLYLIHEADRNPGCNVLFVGLTRASAKAIIWKDILKDIDSKHGLKAKPNLADLTLTLPNGSLIAVTGIDANEEEMKKLLGRKWRLVIIDEASMYTIDLRNFVYGVLGPAMTDPNEQGDSGTICLMGTASDFPRGLFFDITTGKENGWKLFEWSAHDNPHVAKQWAAAIEEIKRTRPAYMETPQFKQWFLNQWVVDEEKLCYKFRLDRNLMRAALPHLPDDGWARILGIDLGWEDDTAFVDTAYHINDPRLFVTGSYAEKKMDFDMIETRILKIMAGPNPPHKIVVDGANKQGVESMRARSSIPFEYADKQDKATFIELCNGDMIQGLIQVLDTQENRGLWLEMGALVWDTLGGVIKIPKKEHPALPNHRCDAFLYAWRMGYHYHVTPVVKKAVIGSKEWYEQQAVDIWEKERARLMAGEQQTEWPTPPADPWGDS